MLLFFTMLIDQWHRNNGCVNSTSKIVKNPASVRVLRKLAPGTSGTIHNSQRHDMYKPHLLFPVSLRTCALKQLPHFLINNLWHKGNDESGGLLN